MLTASAAAANAYAENLTAPRDGMITNLLTKKDEIAETFLSSLLESVRERLPSTLAGNSLSADEYREIVLTEAGEQLHRSSIMLAHKYGPIMKQYIAEEYDSMVYSSLATVEVPEKSVLCMSSQYLACFKAFIEATDCLSFATGNPKLLGKVAPADVFVLTFFAMITCKRTKNDNTLQLVLSGITSCGKSTLFENVLMQGAHSLATEKGCGRFDVGRKNVLLLHDTNLQYLVASSDTEKFKTICRTETTNVKVHGSTATVPPVFVFVTMNQRLQDHTFLVQAAEQRTLSPSLLSSWSSGSLPFFDEEPHQPAQVKKPQSLKQPLMEDFLSGRSGPDKTWRREKSDVETLLGGKRLEGNRNTVDAIQSRFLECYVRKKPNIDLNQLPTAGSFNRSHFIFGTFEYMLAILEKYGPSDFCAPMLYRYVLAGLCKNLTEFLALQLCHEYRAQIDARLADAVQKYCSNKEECATMFSQVEQVAPSVLPDSSTI